jgi:hypothetical protein
LNPEEKLPRREQYQQQFVSALLSFCCRQALGLSQSCIAEASRISEALIMSGQLP